MADYTIRTRYEVEDRSLAPIRKIEKANRGLEQAQKSVQASARGHAKVIQLTERLATAQTHAARGARMLGLGLASAVGLAYTAYRAKRWLVDYNTDMEQARIGMAALLSTSAGFAEGATAQERFARSMKAAPGIIDGLRKAAASGLGQFSDYLEGYQLTMKPMMDAGASAKDVLRTTKLLVPVAQTLRIPMHIAAMDIQQMLMGMSRTTDRLPKMLGLAAKEVNALARSNPAKLLGRINAELAKWAPAAGAFGQTLTAQTDTLLDRVRQLAGGLGAGLTTALGGAVAELNGYLLDHRKELEQWARFAGAELAAGFRRAFGFAVDSARFIAKNWDRIAAVAKQILTTWIKIKAAQLAGAAYQAGAAIAGGRGSEGMMRLRGSDWLGRSLGGAASSVAAGLGKDGKLGTAFDPMKAGVGKLGAAFGVVAAGLVGWEMGQWLVSMGVDDAIADILGAVTGRTSRAVENREFNASERRRKLLSMQGRLSWWMESEAGRSKAGGRVYTRRGRSDTAPRADTFANLARQLRQGDTLSGQQLDDGRRERVLRDYSIGFVRAIRSGEYAPAKGSAEARKAYELLLGMAQKPSVYGLRKGEVTAQEAAAHLWRQIKREEKKELKGRTKVAITVEEVRIDARGTDPDDIAIAIGKSVYQAAEFRLRSSFAPLGAL